MSAIWSVGAMRCIPVYFGSTKFCAARQALLLYFACPCPTIRPFLCIRKSSGAVCPPYPPRPAARSVTGFRSKRSPQFAIFVCSFAASMYSNRFPLDCSKPTFEIFPALYKSSLIESIAVSVPICTFWEAALPTNAPA